MPRQLSRRRLAQLGAIALTGFAGCGSPGGEEDGGGGEEGGGEGGGEEEDAIAPPDTR